MSQAAVWKRCVDAISTLIEEGIFSVTEGKIRFNSMDPARISMVDFELSSEAFETYELDAPKNIGVNLHVQDRLLKDQTIDNVDGDSVTGGGNVWQTGVTISYGF